MDDINEDDDGLKKAKITKKNRIKVEVVIKVKRRKLIRFSFIKLEKIFFFSKLFYFYIYIVRLRGLTGFEEKEEEKKSKIL